MLRWLAFPSVQIALSLALFALGAWKFGPIGAAVTSPLLGAVLARPVLALIANARERVRENFWLPVHGHHYVYKGVTVQVREDDDRCRWVRMDDVRKIVGETAADRSLAAAFTGRCKQEGAHAWLRDDALIEHLGRENNATALRLRTWVERTVAIPGRRVRSGLGIHPQPPDHQASTDSPRGRG